ncbi:FAD binding domain-containing protein [Niallia sp. 01092]|uniref:FAD binding domain-containing protein n=1 Tax=unclassified Niallia TaxID=2837522 RepID=UPI003FD2BCA1
MNFDYFLPADLEEATSLFHTLNKDKKHPLYFSGGTEILTLGRLNMVQTNAVIDIKKLDACLVHQLEGDYLVFGSALTLTEIEEKNLFPLLTEVSKEVADLTVRNKITLGGNICGAIFYREAVLPLLLTDSILLIKRDETVHTEMISSIFKEKLRINKGDLFVQALIEKKYITAPFVTVKKRQQWETGYPLITAAALKINNQIRIAFSGLCPFPFRSQTIEKTINDQSLKLNEKLDTVINHLPTPILDDIEGSSEYRLFVLRNLLKDILEVLERGQYFE